MKKILTLLSVCLSLGCFAQQQKGDLSIQFSGNYFSQKGKVGDTDYQISYGNIYVKIGQFFTPNVELGVKPNVMFYLEDDSEDSKKKNLKMNVGFGLYGTYSYLTADGKMVPYAGGEVNYIPYGKESTINLGPYAGVKYFLRENVNIDANVNYSINVGSSFGSQDVDFGAALLLNVGIGVLIGNLNQ